MKGSVLASQVHHTDEEAKAREWEGTQSGRESTGGGGNCAHLFSVSRWANVRETSVVRKPGDNALPEGRTGGMSTRAAPYVVTGDAKTTQHNCNKT